MSALPREIHELARDTDLQPLWSAVHDRLCAGSEPARLATVRVAGLPAGGVAVLRAWLDTTTRRRRGPSAVTVSAGVTQVPLRELLARIDVSADQLPVLTELAVGRPVVNRSAARQAGVDARTALWSRVRTDLALVPGVATRMQTAGVSDDDLHVVAQEARRLGSALAVLDDLCRPGSRPVTLAKLAHDCAGDPHAFDLHTVSGQRLVEAIAELRDEVVPLRPDEVRALLARAGVLADRLSSTVVVLNLSASGAGPVDQRLRLGGGPVPLTLYDLTVHPPELVAGSSVLVVENPSVLEAAMAAGFVGPLACTSGHLRAVDHAFLQRAVDCGLALYYSGDIDRDGLIIAAQIQAMYGATLCGMDEDVVVRAGDRPSVVPLGTLPSAVSGELATQLSVLGRAIYQEHNAVLQTLFDNVSARP